MKEPWKRTVLLGMQHDQWACPIKGCHMFIQGLPSLLWLMNQPHQKAHTDTCPNRHVYNTREVLTTHHEMVSVSPTNYTNVNSPCSLLYFRKFHLWIEALGLLDGCVWKTHLRFVPDKSFLFPDWLGKISHSPHPDDTGPFITKGLIKDKLQATSEPWLVSCHLYTFPILLIHVWEYNAHICQVGAVEGVGEIRTGTVTQLCPPPSVDIPQPVMGDGIWLQGRKGHLNLSPDAPLGFSLCNKGQGWGADTNVWLLPPEAWALKNAITRCSLEAKSTQ